MTDWEHIAAVLGLTTLACVYVLTGHGDGVLGIIVAALVGLLAGHRIATKSAKEIATALITSTPPKQPQNDVLKPD
jgi:hypothetical protein